MMEGLKKSENPIPKMLCISFQFLKHWKVLREL